MREHDAIINVITTAFPVPADLPAPVKKASAAFAKLSGQHDELRQAEKHAAGWIAEAEAADAERVAAAYAKGADPVDPNEHALAIRPDLLDRAIPLYLPRLRRWVPEDEFFERFGAARPRLLGALLDAVSAAIANLPAVEFNGAVRMADFAKWTIAAERALGLDQGEFMRAYAGNRAEAVEITLEASPLAEPLRSVAAEGFEGTATELLAKLAGLVEEKVTHGDSWPRSPQALSADLGRLAPVLRRVEVEVERPRRRKGKRLIVIRTGPLFSVTRVTGVTPEASKRAKGDEGDEGDEEKHARSSADGDLAWLGTAPIDDLIAYFEEHGSA